MRIRLFDMLLTAMAPAIWGSACIVTTELLPNYSPLTVAMLRALPAGLLPLVGFCLVIGSISWPGVFRSSARTTNILEK